MDKKKLKRIVHVLFFIFLCFIYADFFWPKTFEQLRPEAFDGTITYCYYELIPSDPEGNLPKIEAALPLDSQTYTQLLELLNGTTYTSALKDLAGWKNNSYATPDISLTPYYCRISFREPLRECFSVNLYGPHIAFTIGDTKGRSVRHTYSTPGGMDFLYEIMDLIRQETGPVDVPPTFSGYAYSSF